MVYFLVFQLLNRGQMMTAHVRTMPGEGAFRIRLDLKYIEWLSAHHLLFYP